jgi:hypothetical protein
MEETRISINDISMEEKRISIKEEDINLLLFLKTPEIYSIKSIIIFDWDDTLFPTMYFRSNSYMIDNPSLIPDDIKKQLHIIAANIIQVITCAKNYGYVSIISNATADWVYSCIQIIPEIIPIIETIKIISAQDRWKFYTSNPAKWKEYTFFQEIIQTITSINCLNSKNIYNLISIGDSIHEHDALRYNASKLLVDYPGSIYAKTLKFIVNPTFQQIINQLQTVSILFSSNEYTDFLDNYDFVFPN